MIDISTITVHNNFEHHINLFLNEQCKISKENYEITRHNDDTILVKYIYEPQYFEPDHFISEVCGYSGYLMKCLFKEIGTIEISPNVYEFTLEKIERIIHPHYESFLIHQIKMFWMTFTHMYENKEITRLRRSELFLGLDENNSVLKFEYKFPLGSVAECDLLKSYVEKLFRKEGDKIAINYNIHTYIIKNEQAIIVTIYIA